MRVETMSPKPAPKAESSPKAGGAAYIKWVVLGVIALAFMALFQKELGRLLDRTSDLSITSSGIQIKTVDTPLGKADVSAVVVKESEAPATGIQGTRYTSRQYKLQISWPDASKWSASESTGQALAKQLELPPTISIPIVILHNEVVSNFRPNVNVVVEKVGSMPIREYIDATVQGVSKMGWHVLSTSVDPATNAGFVVLLNKSFGSDIYQVQRIVMAHGNAYVVTASQLPPDNVMSAQLREDLLAIINSFRILS